MEEELKETIQILHKQIDLYKDRIDKAIEYISILHYKDITPEEKECLLKILKGE